MASGQSPAPTGKGKEIGLIEKAKEMTAKMLAAGEPFEKVMAYTGLGKALVGRLKKIGS